MQKVAGWLSNDKDRWRQRSNTGSLRWWGWWVRDEVIDELLVATLDRWIWRWTFRTRTGKRSNEEWMKRWAPWWTAFVMRERAFHWGPHTDREDDSVTTNHFCSKLINQTAPHIMMERQSALMIIILSCPYTRWHHRNKLFKVNRSATVFCFCFACYIHASVGIQSNSTTQLTMYSDLAS